MFERTFIGLDVHAKTIVACALDTATGEVIRAKMNPDPVAVLAWLQTLAGRCRRSTRPAPPGSAWPGS